jgi:hypothetical protein
MEPMEIILKSVTSVTPNFHWLWLVDGSYWAVTSVGYGQRTKVRDFYFFKKILEKNDTLGENWHNRQ